MHGKVLQPINNAAVVRTLNLPARDAVDGGEAWFVWLCCTDVSVVKQTPCRTHASHMLEANIQPCSRNPLERSMLTMLSQPSQTSQDPDGPTLNGLST